MTITAEILADSISAAGKRITTYLLRYPRFIHAEVMTHRVFSRNASSSRAVPIFRLIDEILSSTAMPIHWGKNQPGMQAFEENEQVVRMAVLEYEKITNGTDEVRTGAFYVNYGNHLDEAGRAGHMTPQEAWIGARDNAVVAARAFAEAGYHKQIVNRLLEPFAHINVVLTTTEIENYDELRRHKDAQPEIKALADAMYEARQNSTPELIVEGQWHLPFITPDDEAAVIDFLMESRPRFDPPTDEQINLLLRKVSAARCARTSYRTFHGKISTVREDLDLCEKLIGGRPLHASPFEHQATPDTRRTIKWCEVFPDGTESNFHLRVEWRHPEDHRNLVGWRQSRAFLERDVLANDNNPTKAAA